MHTPHFFLEECIFLIHPQFSKGWDVALSHWLSFSVYKTDLQFSVSSPFHLRHTSANTTQLTSELLLRTVSGAETSGNGQRFS